MFGEVVSAAVEQGDFEGLGEGEPGCRLLGHRSFPAG